MMKQILVTAFFFLALTFSVQSQTFAKAYNPTNETELIFNNYKVNLEQSDPVYSLATLEKSLMLEKEQHKLERTGKALFFTGLPLAALGYVMLKNGESINGDVNAAGVAGGIIFPVGVALLASGAVVWPIGRALRK